MRIFFDLDGVLRDLAGFVLGEEVVYWNQKTIYGKTVPEAVTEKPCEYLIFAPSTIYLDYLKDNFKEVTIISNQPISWRKYTDIWLRVNMPPLKYCIIYTDSNSKKLKYIDNCKAMIVDDYPFYENYDRIIILDAPYNRHIKASYRIHDIAELDYLIKSLILKNE